MIDFPAVVLAAATPAAGGSLQDQFVAFAPIILMFVAAYFLLLRPQQKRAADLRAQVSAVKRGDTVVLSSGMIGKVVRVEDTELGVEIAQNVTVKVVKAMVAEVRSRGEPAAANDAKT